MAVDPSVTFVDAPRPADGETSGGAAGAAQIRLGPVGFDGSGATLDGADRPNPRAISNEVFSQLDASGDPVDIPNAGGFSSLLWVWGQFLDHDLSQTSNGSAFGRANIVVPAGDPVFVPGSELGFNRSESIGGSGTSADNPRQYENQITAFIDGSNLYGSDAAKLAALLEPGTAKLRLTAEGTIGFASADPIFRNGAITGDTRANENVALLSMHALFAREHNRIVDELAAADPGLGADALFQGARARVEAILQAITYNDFLPALIGEGSIADYGGFRSSVNPAISLEFSTAVYRFGHTLLSPTIARMNEDGSTVAQGDLALRDAFQQRGVVEQTGIEAILRGMSTTMSQELDTFVVEDVRSLLFGAGGPGTDLAALNIQRGRDHGLPTYNEMRVALGLEPRTSFAEITGDAAVAARLSSAYGGDISKLDLWVGGLAEDGTGGGMLGQTFRAVMIDQFTRLRDGDAFWSEARGFSAAERDALWSTTLADVIRRNSGVIDLQDDAFLAFARLAGGAAADTLTGGSGRNLIIGAGGADTLIGGAIDDHLSGGDGGDRLEGRGGANVLVGGAGADTFVIHVDRANQTRLRDFTAQDVIEFAKTANAAEIIVEDGPQGAIVRIGRATLVVEGVRAADLPFGAGPLPPPGQTLTGGAAADTLTGGAADDTISGLGGADTLDGLGGADLLIGGAGDDGLNGGDGADRLAGEAGVDRLDGGAGDDSLFVQRAADAADTLIGGSGVDTLRVTGSGSTVTLAGTGRISGVEVFDGAGRDVIGTAGGNILDFSIFDTVTGIASIQGLDGADTLIGGAAADALLGGAGDDRLEGRGGADDLTGGAGVDTFVIHVDRAGPTTIRDWTPEDVIAFAAAAGVAPLSIEDGPDGAVIRFGAATLLVEGVAAASLPFAPPPPPGVTLNGNAANNTLTGGAGDDTLNGNGGDDILGGLGERDFLNGGAGLDTLNGGAGDDVLNGGQGRDTVDGGDGDDLILISGTLAQTDTMTGGAGIDTIRNTDPGADVTLFGTGNVSGVEIFDAAGRSVIGSIGADIFDFSDFSTVAGVASIRGGNGADTITGGVGADVILGESGADLIAGAAGADRLTGGGGGDVFHLVAGFASGRDTITDFDAAGNDLLRLDGFGFGAADPGALTDAQRLNAVAAATLFDAGGATIDLAALGGAGEIRLDGVTVATLTFGPEDFVFG